MPVLTREQVQAHWLALGYTHVGTLAGPVPIAKWLEPHEPGQPDPSEWHFELRPDHSPVDGAVADDDPNGPWKRLSSMHFYRGIWRPLKLAGEVPS
jgi:hypothetical protein